MKDDGYIKKTSSYYGGLASDKTETSEGLILFYFGKKMTSHENQKDLPILVVRLCINAGGIAM